MSCVNAFIIFLKNYNFIINKKKVIFFQHTYKKALVIATFFKNQIIKETTKYDNVNYPTCRHS